MELPADMVALPADMVELPADMEDTERASGGRAGKWSPKDSDAIAIGFPISIPWPELEF
ncbi:hypothetical protein [Nocardia sp. CNY236]|uniref:hypothetical protein n=1 Tax=Nocardia sp. CNY236 TaxID=1169152 RepID=UPI00042977EA|nr:hypothetical protein [Nocardia sp. CNY236]